MQKQKGRKGQRAGIPPVFEDSFKIMVARDYLLGDLSYPQVAMKYDIASGETVRWFVRWYKQWEKTQSDQGSSITVMAAGSGQMAEELAKAHLRITALEMLIENAEKELGIDIKKKSGLKRQDK